METSTRKILDVEILPIEHSDYKLITPKRYFFDWKKEKEYEIYKLTLKSNKDILGLVSIERIAEEWRIHIRLLTVSVENKGKNKKYDKITGNIIAYVARIAITEYGALACVSLRPKTKIAKHYISKYKMNYTGITLSIEVPEILDLIREYE